MRNKKWMVWGLLLAVGALLASPAVYADSRKGGSGKKGLSAMFFKKAHFILKNDKELGLSDEQVKAIRALKVETKKQYIRHKAEADTIGVDIKAELYEDKPNVERLGTLIDEKYTVKAAKAKLIAGAFAQLKGQLSDLQWDKMRELKKEWKSSRSEGSHGKR